MEEQSYQKHSMLVPGFHFVTFGLLALNILWAGWRLFQTGLPLPDRIWGLAMALAFALLAWYTRIFPLKVQDRVIRLEERLRLAKLLPADLVPRIPELTPSQLIALRFASDGEVAELTRKVLTENLRSRDEIKKLIRQWRPDHFRV
ncbi:MAG TPA: hypothetical protein DD490_22050 [Acidobacteria bacterium]|nr:hypothetical protein [Acidobacteriota bacterium]